MKKSFTKIGLTLMVISMLMACASASQLMKNAEKNWKKKNFKDALLNAITALQKDNEIDEAKAFLMNHYEQGIALIEYQIDQIQSEKEPEKSIKEVEYYSQLQKINSEMNGFSYPLSDLEKTFSWTPKQIKDFAPSLKNAQVNIANIYLEKAFKSKVWKEIEENGMLALNYAANDSHKKEITDKISESFYSNSIELYNKGTEEDLIYALEGLDYTEKWQKNYKETAKWKNEIKIKLAEGPYNEANVITSNSKSSRSELKKAKDLFLESNKWIENYKNLNEEIKKIDQRLELYAYCIFDSNSYKYVKKFKGENNLPVDIRGLYLEGLISKFSEKSYYHFNNEAGNFASIFNQTIWNGENKKSETAKFITTATKNHVDYIVAVKVLDGKAAGEIKLKAKMKKHHRKFKIDRVKIVFVDTEGNPQEIYTIPTKENLKKIKKYARANKKTSNTPESLKFYRNILIESGASIPENIPFTHEIETLKDKVEYEVETQKFEYPILVTAEIYDIQKGKVIKKADAKQTQKGVYSQRTANVLKNAPFFDESIDIPKEKQIITELNESLVTEDIIKKLFDKINGEIAPVLKSKE